MRIRIKGMEEASAEIIAAVRSGVDSALEVCGARGQALVQQNITSPFLGRPPAVATGILVNSITFEVSREVSIARAVVFAAPPADKYVDPVETGTMPHFPPPHALLLWVRRKFGVDDEKKALSIAFAVARTIAKRGTSGFGMFARATPVLEAEAPGIFERSIAASIEQAGLAK